MASVPEVISAIEEAAPPGLQALDDSTLVVSMQVLDTEHSEVGQGNDRWSQSANAFKRCARHFGIGRYLTQLPIVRLKLGEQVPVNGKGSPYITDELLGQLRVSYERQVAELEGRFGPILPHPGVGAGEHEGETPTHPGVEPDAGTRGAPEPNDDGHRVRRHAAARGLGDAELGNLVRQAAGQDTLPEERARMVLPHMLARIPASIADRTITLIDQSAPTGEDFAGYEPPPAA